MDLCGAGSLDSVLNLARDAGKKLSELQIAYVCICTSLHLMLIVLRYPNEHSTPCSSCVEGLGVLAFQGDRARRREGL